MTNVFEENGLSQQDVKKWQTEKKLEHLTDTALCQLYLRVVKKKSFRPPNPIYTVQQIWDKIDKIATGQEEKPNNNKLYVGIKDINVVALIRDVPYQGCPECTKSKKTLKKNFCTDHNGTTPLEELHITEWAIFDGDDQFIMKLFARLSPKYPEHLMVGAKDVWVEGNIDLSEDPISLTVNNFRTFTPGKLLGVGNLVEDEVEDIGVDRSDVVIEGFDEDEEVEEKSPFEVDEAEKVSPFDTPRDNGLSAQFMVDLREQMKEMLKDYASKSSVPKSSVTRAMKTWVGEAYPEEFEDLDAVEGKLWEAIGGLYSEEEDDRILYKGE